MIETGSRSAASTPPGYVVSGGRRELGHRSAEGAQRRPVGRRVERDLRRLARTPKGLLTGVLLLLAAIAGRVEGPALVGPGMVAAVITAVALDVPLLRWRRQRWAVPSGAIVTALIVGLVVSGREPWHVPAAAVAIGIASKHLIRARGLHVLNPAAAGLVAVFYLLDSGQNWWGALPGVDARAAFSLLVGLGWFMANRVNRLPATLAFVVTVYAVFTTAAFLGDPASVADVFVPPDANAVLFCAAFILTDPPTSPARVRDQVVCAVLSALAASGVFAWAGSAHYLLAGTLAGNVYATWRRTRHVHRRPAAARVH